MGALQLRAARASRIATGLRVAAVVLFVLAGVFIAIGLYSAVTDFRLSTITIMLSAASVAVSGYSLLLSSRTWDDTASILKRADA